MYKCQFMFLMDEAPVYSAREVAPTDGGQTGGGRLVEGRLERVFYFLCIYSSLEFFPNTTLI